MTALLLARSSRAPFSLHLEHAIGLEFVLVLEPRILSFPRHGYAKLVGSAVFWPTTS